MEVQYWRAVWYGVLHTVALVYSGLAGGPSVQIRHALAPLQIAWCWYSSPGLVICQPVPASDFSLC